MDVAKYRLPRNVSAIRAKELEGSWRPELHATCTLVEGLEEVYWISDQDLRKDASSSITLVLAALQRACRKVTAFPRRLRVHSDNAASEAKNQAMLKMGSVLISLGVLDEFALSQFRVGHSHSKIDARFSECRHILNCSHDLQEHAFTTNVERKHQTSSSQHLGTNNVSRP